MIERPTERGAHLAGHRATVPEQLSVALTGVAVGGLVLEQLTGSLHVGLVCPLRVLTGLPCPLCGMTTSASALAKLRFTDALSANPFFPVLALLVAAIVAITLGRRAGLVAAARHWGPTQRRRASIVALGGLTFSWLWQLHRFDWF